MGMKLHVYAGPAVILRSDHSDLDVERDLGERLVHPGNEPHHRHLLIPNREHSFARRYSDGALDGPILDTNTWKDISAFNAEYREDWLKLSKMGYDVQIEWVVVPYYM